MPAGQVLLSSVSLSTSATNMHLSSWWLLLGTLISSHAQRGTFGCLGHWSKRNAGESQCLVPKKHLQLVAAAHLKLMATLKTLYSKKIVSTHPPPAALQQTLSKRGGEGVFLWPLPRNQLSAHTGLHSPWHVSTPLAVRQAGDHLDRGASLSRALLICGTVPHLVCPTNRADHRTLLQTEGATRVIQNATNISRQLLRLRGYISCVTSFELTTIQTSSSST